MWTVTVIGVYVALYQFEISFNFVSENLSYILVDLGTETPHEQASAVVVRLVCCECFHSFTYYLMFSTCCLIQVVGLTEVEVKSADEIMNCLIEGSKSRTTGTTAMNKQSSRSHAIFTIYLQRTSHTDTWVERSVHISHLIWYDLISDELIALWFIVSCLVVAVILLGSLLRLQLITATQFRLQAGQLRWD